MGFSQHWQQDSLLLQVDERTFYLTRQFSEPPVTWTSRVRFITLAQCIHRGTVVRSEAVGKRSSPIQLRRRLKVLLRRLCPAMLSVAAIPASAAGPVPPPMGHYAYIQNYRLTVFHNEALIEARTLPPPCLKRGPLYYNDCPQAPRRYASGQMGSMVLYWLAPPHFNYMANPKTPSDPAATISVPSGGSVTVDLPRLPGCLKISGEVGYHIRLKPRGDINGNAFEFELPPAELSSMRVPIALSPCSTPFQYPRATGAYDE